MTKLLKAPIEQDIAAPAQNQTNPPQRILLVDDDFYVRELNAGVLIRYGYKVDTADDGADAWKALNEIRYDLLITDNKMARVSGLELIKKLRSVDMTLPVILASGTAPTEELKRHPWLKLDATLPKPFTVAQLLDTVKKVLRTPDSNNSKLDMKTNIIPRIEEPAIAPAQRQTNPAQRILVVDDDSDVRQLSVDVLTGCGYDVAGAKDGADGWDELQSNIYDLVITDNKMPRMTGIEMLEKVRSARMSLPVIMATGHLPTHEFARKPWLTPDATLQRPFSADDLVKVVKKVLRPEDGSTGRKEASFPIYL